MAESFMRTRHAPGVALCVIQHGKILVSRGYGIADLENAVPVSRDSEFAMASITKQLTAAGILHLAEKRMLDLDDGISRFVPDLPDNYRGVTIRRLLNHTAGVKNLQDLGDRYWGHSHGHIEPKGLIDLFRGEPLDFEPGTDYHYSNSGYVLLGAAIEKTGGEPYGDYVRHHLLDRLGIKHMIYPESLALLEHRVRPYWYNGKAFVNAAYFDPSAGFAMGGVYSTAEDLALWTEALHHGRVLSPYYYQLMITPETLLDGEPLSYGYGMEVGSIEGHTLYAHAGGGVGFISQALYVPDEDLTIAVMSNSNFDGGAVEMADRVLRRILRVGEPLDLPLPPGAAGRYAGWYCLEDEIVEIALAGGNLLVRDGSGSRRLLYQGNGAFAQEGRLARLHFREERGQVEGFVIARYGSLLAKATREN
jgi:CubicO group peptidase (beta-lactamase class C family)